MLGDITEQRAGNSHEEGGWNTLARYIANAEKQLLVADVEVEQVTSNTLGWCQRTIDVQIITFWVGRERLRQHRHLDIVSHLHLILDSSLLGCSIAQIFDIASQ